MKKTIYTAKRPGAIAELAFETTCRSETAMWAALGYKIRKQVWSESLGIYVKVGGIG